MLLVIPLYAACSSALCLSLVDSYLGLQCLFKRQGCLPATYSFMLL